MSNVQKDFNGAIDRVARRLGLHPDQKNQFIGINDHFKLEVRIDNGFQADILTLLNCFEGKDVIEPWKPILSAPKDGTIIDIWVSHEIGAITPAHYRVTDVKWCNERGWVFAHKHSKATGELLTFEEEWMVPIFWMNQPPKPIGY